MSNEYINVKDSNESAEVEAFTIPGSPGTSGTGFEDFPMENDPTYRIGRLKSANSDFSYIHPDQPIAKAVTLMMSNGYSQLPVMKSKREVVGVIGWRSIGMHLHLCNGCETVREVMEDAVIVSEYEPIFSVIPKIELNDYVLIQKCDKQISGIVTASDLAGQFCELSESFLLLGEIEKHLRSLVDKAMRPEELSKYCELKSSERVIHSASDLTLGEIERVLQGLENWARFNLKLDRTEFTKQLGGIRIIRNGIMHFYSKAPKTDEIQKLRKFASLLRDLRNLGLF